MKTKGICAFLLAVILTLGICSCAIGETSAEKKYNQAVADVESGKYEEAIAAFESLKGYKDSVKYIMYARCRRAGDSGDYENAIKSLTSLGDFRKQACMSRTTPRFPMRQSRNTRKRARSTTPSCSLRM